jgi:hypothetical protein
MFARRARQSNALYADNHAYLQQHSATSRCFRESWFTRLPIVIAERRGLLVQKSVGQRDRCDTPGGLRHHGRPEM